MEVVGRPLYCGFAEAFDVSPNTIKTWRKRGAVSTKYLQGFAKEHGASLDYLMHGNRDTSDQGPALTTEELLLVEKYRASSKEIRNAVMRVLLGGDDPGPARSVAKQTVKSNRGQVTQSGDIAITKGSGRTK